MHRSAVLLTYHHQEALLRSWDTDTGHLQWETVLEETGRGGRYLWRGREGRGRGGKERRGEDRRGRRGNRVGKQRRGRGERSRSGKGGGEREMEWDRREPKRSLMSLAQIYFLVISNVVSQIFHSVSAVAYSGCVLGMHIS